MLLPVVIASQSGQSSSAITLLRFGIACRPFLVSASCLFLSCRWENR